MDCGVLNSYRLWQNLAHRKFGSLAGCNTILWKSYKPQQQLTSPGDAARYDAEEGPPEAWRLVFE